MSRAQEFPPFLFPPLCRGHTRNVNSSTQEKKKIKKSREYIRTHATRWPHTALRRSGGIDKWLGPGSGAEVGLIEMNFSEKGGGGGATPN